MAQNPFYPTMTHFTLPLHATREELITLAADWAAGHELHVSIERFHPHYSPAALPFGADVRAAIAAFEPVRRICLRTGGSFDVNATNEIDHLSRNPNSFVISLEPLTEDGLRATALTGRMRDEDVLRWWISLVREATVALHQGATATTPQGGRTHIPHHFHTEEAHRLALDGVAMRAETGPSVFQFDDIG